MNATPPEIKIQLGNGRQIRSSCWITSHCTRGALLYTPCERANRNFMRVAESEAKTFFREQPIILVPPQITYGDDYLEYLPAVRMIAEFSSAPIDDEFDLSSAVIIWYQQDLFPLIGDDVRSDFEEIEWERHAKDEKLCL